MAEYIEREAALGFAVSGRIRTLPTTENGESWIRVKEVRESLKSIPAANVRENVKGEWIESDQEEPFLFCGHTYYPPRHCSVCGRTALDEPWTFCPNCGAQMNGGRE